MPELCRPFLVSIAAFLATAVSAYAQDLGSLQWAKNVWKAADEAFLPPNTYIEWDYEPLLRADLDEFRRLEREVEGKPHHPNRKKYKQLKVLLIDGERLSERHRLWYSDTDTWRLAADRASDSEIAFSDYAMSKGNADWTLSPNSVRIERSGSDTPGFDLRGRLSGLRSMWSIWSVGVPRGTGFDLTPIATETSGQSWTCRLEGPKGDRAFEVIGQFSPDGKELKILEYRVARTPEGPANQIAMRFSLHSDDTSPFGIKQAKSVELYNREGPIAKYTFIGTRQLADGETDPLVAVPMPDGSDPIRGMSTYTGVIDHTGTIPARSTAPGPTEHNDKQEHRKDSFTFPLVAIGGACGIVLMFALLKMNNATQRTKK